MARRLFHYSVGTSPSPECVAWRCPLLIASIPIATSALVGIRNGAGVGSLHANSPCEELKAPRSKPRRFRSSTPQRPHTRRCFRAVPQEASQPTPWLSTAEANTLFSPAQDIASWTTEDLVLKANIPDHANALWRDLSLVLNIQNLADRRPPFLAIPAGDIAIGRSAVPFDGTNASAVGRYVSLEIRIGW
jgi:hypothetical protein